MMANKKLTLHQKKEIIQLHLANPKLGYTKLAKMIPEKLDFALSRSSIRLVLKNKEQLLETVTSEFSTRTHFLNESMNRFRARVFDEIKNEKASYAQIKILCQKLKEDPEFAAAFNKGNENQNPNQQAGENEIRNFNATFNVNHEEFHAEFPGISDEDHQMAHSANQEWDESNANQEDNSNDDEQDSMVKVAQQHTKFHADNPNMADDAEEHEALHEELDARMARLMDFAA